MTKEKRHGRRESPEQEPVNSVRPQRRRTNRSPAMTRDRSPARREIRPVRGGSRSPGYRRSRSSSHRGADVRIKRSRWESDRPTERDRHRAKEKPNFEPSGALTEETTTFREVVIKYNEPPEARIPKIRWRLYPFKNDDPLPVMYIHRQSAYLLGRQRKIADIPIDHPSCSKQHAVFQYRLVPFARADGSRRGLRVRPYVIDLGSTNGTYLNHQRIEAQRYYELKEKDVIKFGSSSREYVLLHELSDTKREEEDDDEGLDK